MSKRILRSVVVMFCMLHGIAVQSQGNAATVSGGPFRVSAQVPSTLTLELSILDPVSGAEKSLLDFGELTRVGGEFRAERFFKVLLKVNTAGDSFGLTQIATPLTRSDSAETIPSGAYVVKPTYVEADNTGLSQPTGSQIGTAGTAVGTRTLFADSTGAGRVITLTYTLSGDPSTGATEVIPLSQRSGFYTGTIQFTLTT